MINYSQLCFQSRWSADRVVVNVLLVYIIVQVNDTYWHRYQYIYIVLFTTNSTIYT